MDSGRNSATMDSGRNSTLLNSRYTGPNSPWEKAKERAALHHKSALRTAAEIGSLPSDYCALKGDYTRVSNTTGNPYMDSGPGIQDVGKIPPTNYPPVYPPNEKAVSDYLNRETVSKYIRPGVDNLGNLKASPSDEETKKYDFLSQTPGITRDNISIPKPHLRETVSYNMPRAKDLQPGGINHRLHKPDYTSFRPAQEGRIGVEHSLNKSLNSLSAPATSWDGRQYPTENTCLQPPSMNPESIKPKELKNFPELRQDLASHDYKPGGAYPDHLQDMPPPELKYTTQDDSSNEISPQLPPQPMENTSLVDLQKTPSQHTGSNPIVNLSELHKPEPNFESLALKGLKRIRTTNQTYGSWIGDPFLEGKDWYRSPRFPHVKSYLTKHREESGSWM